MGNCCIIDNSQNYNLLTSINKRNQKMNMILKDSEINNENMQHDKIDKSNDNFNFNLDEDIYNSEQSKKTVEKQDNSDITQLDKVKVINTENIQEARSIIDNLKNTTNFLTPENTPKNNFISVEHNKNSMHMDSHFFIKESIIRRNSNYFSDNHSLIQDKENIFGNGTNYRGTGNNIDRTKNRFSLCNNDIPNMEIDKEQHFDINKFDVNDGKFLINSQNFEQKKSSPIMEEKKESINFIKEKPFNINLQSINKHVIKSAKIYNKTKPSIVSLSNQNDSKLSVENEKIAIASARGLNDNQKMRKIIPKKLTINKSPKRKTNRSENSQISSSQKEKSENPKHDQKVKEFEHIIKKTKLNSNNNSLIRNNTTTTKEYLSNQNYKKVELYDDYNSNQLPSQISINKYKFIFSDVDANMNNKNHNYSQGNKHYNSYQREKDEIKNFIPQTVNDFSENKNENMRNSFITNKIANVSNILN